MVNQRASPASGEQRCHQAKHQLVISCRDHIVDVALKRTQAVVQQWHTGLPGPPTDSGESFAVIDLSAGKDLGNSALACGQHADSELARGYEVFNRAGRLTERNRDDRWIERDRQE